MTRSPIRRQGEPASGPVAIRERIEAAVSIASSGSSSARRSSSEALRTRLTGTFRADFHIGLPEREHARVAPITEPAPTAKPLSSGAAGGGETSAPPERALMAKAHFATGNDEQDAMLGAVYFNPAGLSGFGGTINTPGWRSAAIPSTNGHGTARAVAALYDTFMHQDVSQGGLVGPGLRAEATSTVAEGLHRVLGKPSRFGLGFQLAQPTRAIGRSERGYGHFGYGGTLGFADPESGVAFGYLMNRPGERWQTPRTNALVDAVYESLT